MKPEWRHESLGWFAGDASLVGAGLVLYRQLPRLKRYLAYLPEGPVIDWDDRPTSATGSAPMTRAPQGSRAPSASGWGRRW